MIRLEGAEKYYTTGAEPIHVLRGISLHIASGEFVSIMGPSGSGKSTLMNILGCLDTLDKGTYELDRRRVDTVNNSEQAKIRNRKFGFVFQQFNLIPRLSALRNVELPMIYGRLPLAERQQRARQALHRVGLGDRCSHTPARLSGGQQQRVAIARALVNDPDVIIADEPTGSLDSHAGEEIMNIFSELHAQGKLIIMVTHEHDIAAYAERIIRLRDGVIAEDLRQ